MSKFALGYILNSLDGGPVGPVAVREMRGFAFVVRGVAMAVYITRIKSFLCRFLRRRLKVEFELDGGWLY